MVNQCMEKFWTLKEKERLEEEVKRLSITDDLTNLTTTVIFIRPWSWRSPVEAAEDVPVAADVRHGQFQAYNDLYGHLEGIRS